MLSCPLISLIISTHFTFMFCHHTIKSHPWWFAASESPLKNYKSFIHSKFAQSKDGLLLLKWRIIIDIYTYIMYFTFNATDYTVRVVWSGIYTFMSRTRCRSRYSLLIKEAAGMESISVSITLINTFTIVSADFHTNGCRIWLINRTCLVLYIGFIMDCRLVILVPEARHIAPE